MPEPYYTHDCDKCIYLGGYVDDKEKVWDLYCCSMGHPTIIARYGNEGSHYVSGIYGGNFQEWPALVAAVRFLVEDFWDLKNGVDINQTFEDATPKPRSIEL